MKILFILPGLNFGGAERVVCILANEFQTQGDKVFILTTATTGQPAYYLNVDIERSGFVLENGKNIRLVYKHLKSIRNKIKQVDPDMIISFITDASIVTILSNLGLKYPIIVSERNDPSKEFKSKKIKVLRKILYPFAKGFVFQSNGAKKYFSKSIQRKSAVILNPLVIKDLPSPYKGERKKEIVSVGRLEAQKNQYLLIKAFSKFHKKHCEYRLIIYGEGTLRKELENKAALLGVKDYVSFPGTVTDVLSKINSAAVFAFTSDFEGIPNALIEAMALGIPCISTDCSPGGAAMLINSYENGILTPINDVQAVTEALNYMIENKMEAQKMGNNAKKIINDTSSEKIAFEWRKYIEQVKKYK